MAAAAGGDPFGEIYAAIGWHPQHRRLLQLLANATAGCGLDAAALAAALLEASSGGGGGAGGALGAPGAAHAPPPPPHGGDGEDPSGPVAISLFGLLLAALIIGVNGAISVWLRLGLHGKLAVATVR